LNPLSSSKVVESKKNGALASSLTALAGMWATWRVLPGPQRERLGWYALSIVLSAMLYIQPLTRLMRHAAQFELHSHIPLVPLVVGHLVYAGRGSQAPVYRTSLGGTVLMCAVAIVALAVALWWRGTLSVNDYLALMVLSFLSVVAAGGFLFLGSEWMVSLALPLSFLLFMIPMPEAIANALEAASMRASADVAALFLTMTGTPLLRDGQVFALPGIVLQVAEECSGIRSSWVLLMTSLLASQLFLRSSWRRIVLVAFVIPLGIVRNGFRILVIALLCVHVGPEMIDSPIHHQGGPLFFSFSLGPLFLLLWWLRRRDL
jgi:exosortase C (VPDSG-CTERM-specific)